MSDIKNSFPIAIGGVGGSGTRLIAEILKELGFYIGSDINESNDNVWFTLLFKRYEVLSLADDEFAGFAKIFFKKMTGNGELTVQEEETVRKLARYDRLQHPAAWLQERVATLLSVSGSAPANTGLWGWKEPNTHLVIDRLQKIKPDISYIHVVRNGLDMAHSTNQNQLRFWGHHFFDTPLKDTACGSLRYWVAAHKRILKLGESMDSFYLLNFDRLCASPLPELHKLILFLKMDITAERLADLAQMVRVPKSIGRYKQYGTKIFLPSDVAFVGKLGFETNV